MSGPWEQYKSSLDSAPEEEAGPWTQYPAQPAAETTEEGPWATFGSKDKPAKYQPTESYPGEHEHLREINALSGREVREIAALHKVNADDLRKLVPYWRVGVEDDAGQGTPWTDDMKKFAGYLGSAAVDLPQFLLKKAQDPAMRAAIDDIRNLASQRKTDVQTKAEFGSGFLLPAGRILKAAQLGAEALTVGKAAGVLGTEIAEQALVGAGLGGAAALAGSKEGEELEEAGKGAAFGAVLGAGLGTVVGGFKVGSAVKKYLGARTAREGEDLVAKVEAEMAKPEVGEAVQRGTDRITRVAEGEAPLLSIELEKIPIQKEIERLKVDDEHLVTLWQANPEVMEEAMRRGYDEETVMKLLAKQEVMNRESLDMIEFAKYLETQKLGKAKTAAEIVQQIQMPDLKKAGEIIKTWASSGGRTIEFLKQEYKNFRGIKLAQEINAENLRRGYKLTSNEATRLVRGYFRTRGQFKIIDNRTKGLTTLERTADQLVQADNLKNAHINEVIADANPVLSQSTDSGLREALTIEKISELEKTGKTALTSPEQAQALSAMLGLFTKGREALGKLGVKIEQISEAKAKVYIPKMQVDDAAATGRIRARITAVEEASGISFKTHFDAVGLEKMREKAPQAFAELVQGLEYLSGRKIGNNPVRLSKYAVQATTVDGTAKMVAAKAARRGAGAAMQRTEVGVPDFLRETDINKLYVRWHMDTLKQAYWRGPLQELTKQRNLLAAAGDRAGVEYVDSFIRSLAGGEKGLARWVTQAKASFIASLEERATKAAAVGRNKSAYAYKLIADNSDIPQLLAGVMYSNLLSSPKTALYNLMQPFLTTVPELSLGGTGWAAAKALRGYWGALASVANPAEARALLKPYAAPKLTKEVVDSFRTGIEHGLAGRAIRGGLQALTDLSLIFIQSSETINRLATIKMADSVALDLMRGNKSAQAFLGSVGEGYKRQFIKLVEEGNQQAVVEMTRDYLVAKTMFHYSPLMASQLGKYLGRMGSALQTWPTTITADIVADFASKGAVGGSYLYFKKYMGPFAALASLDAWMQAHNMSPEDSAQVRALLGRQGAKGASPLQSVGDIGRRGVMSSPYVEDGFKAFAAAASGDAEEWWRSTKNMGKIYIPGRGIKNLLTITIPLITGEEPQEDE